MKNLSKLFPLLIVTCASLFSSLDALEPHETWWENNLEDKKLFNDFQGWLEGINADSRVAMRKHVLKKGYTSFLDVPCGLCVDFWGLKEDRVPVDYQGLDITPRLVKLAQDNGVPVTLGSIESIPFNDSQFDISYARHILEHLSDYQIAITELIRVAKHEALIVFFIKPSSNPTSIDYSPCNNEMLYHNHYNLETLEQFIASNSNVTSFEWEEVNSKENILHIYLSKPRSVSQTLPSIL